MMAFFGCTQAEIEESRAIMPGSEKLVLPAAASEQPFTIYADGTWQVDVDVDWLTVNPTSGKGTMDVTLTVEANNSDEPRDAKITIQGSSLMSDVEVLITQKMDRFRVEKEISVTEALALKEKALAKLSECQVVATTTNGFIVSDGTSNIFVEGTASVKAGDKLTLTGDIIAFNGITAIKLEDAFSTEAAELKYPEATEVDFKEYKGIKSEYVSATVSYADGGILSVDGEQVAKVYNPTTEQNAYAYHKVTVKGYTLGVVDKVPSILVVEIIDIEMEAIPYMQFEIETADFKTANPSFGENHKFNANVGGGYIEYIPDDLANSDPDGVWKMDISGNDPRCTGPWPGDYWYFVGATKVVANSEFTVKFGSRVSATGHKYWMLEYLDGEIWKPAAEVKVSTDMPEGENVEYTHAMNADGGTNIIVDESFSITKNMDRLEMRFRCVTNWQANGKGPLTKRNTGSARLSVKSDGSKGDGSVIAPQPSILITKMGDGQATVDPEPEYANIELSTSVLAFEGAPTGPQTVTVTSDRDFTLTPSVSWITLDVTEGVAGTPTKVNVTCSPSEMTTLRQSKIVIKSGDSKAEVYVVQSAAGSQLEPLISIATGNNITVLGEGEEFSADVQANVEYKVEISDAWITEVVEPATKAIVEKTSHKFVAAANMTGADRVGTVRFYNEEKGIESVLSVKQENFVPRVTITYACGSTIPALPGVASKVVYHVDANIDFTVSADSWIKFPQTSCPKGEYDVTVDIEANPDSQIRTGKATIDFGLGPKEIIVNQYPAGTYYVETFDWVAPYVQQYIDKGKEMGDSMLDNKAYGIGSPYSTISDFDKGMAAAGLQSLYTTRKDEAIYPCLGNYMKFSKTHYMNGLRFPALPISGTADLTLTFDWACSNGDKVTLLVSLEGAGTIEGTCEFTPTAGLADSYEWQPQTVTIKGADSTTRVKIGPKDFQDKKVSGAKQRYFLDNIIIK